MNQRNSAVIPDKVNPRLPGGFNLPPFGIQQILALMIVCIALWAVGVIWLGMQGASQWVGSWQDEIRIHVYLHSKDTDKATALKQKLELVEKVESVRQVSAQEAAAWMQGWLSDARMNQQELADHLPVSFEISLAEGASEFLFSDIRDAATQFGAVVNEDEVNLAQAHQWISQAGYLAGFASLILALAMALIISNTLRMTLLARSDEIHLMRLMGAQEWFVRMPFILEGMVLGAGAGIAAWVLLWPVVIGTGDWLYTMQIDLNSWAMLLPLLFGGGLVGTVGAFIATAKVSSGDIPSN
ncbi:FtsX-like permease family protein [Mariprofundus sp. EBB-1]|uniref:cell division protein FtsX n=1 Tax=Mariprofundus sp. EBB-1 TaxID=2650971 RepID=UPI000EF1BCA2|nr:permease-like cell division protein FtsX [Mariprofundus sp. EBB-1]RLL50697.1 FtsX-like permease family protein [Mariprofundus sp. EBB-1]